MNTYKVHVVTNKKVYKYRIESDNCLVRDNCYYFAREMDHSEEDKKNYGFSKYTVIVAMFPVDKTIVFNDDYSLETARND